MPDYLPKKDAELQAWTATFISVANVNYAALGISSDDMNPIENNTNVVHTDLNVAAAAHSAALNAVQLKNTDVRTLRKNIRTVVKRIQGQPGVPDNLKKALGITVTASPTSRTPPITPTALVANPQAAGINSLSWKTMGNKSTTQYVIYSKSYSPATRLETDTGWTMVGQTTRGKFNHKGVTPGQPLAYKVVAARAQQFSNPSLPVTVYVP